MKWGQYLYFTSLLLKALKKLMRVQLFITIIKVSWTQKTTSSQSYLYPVIFPRFYPSTLSHMQQTPSPCSQPHTHKNKGTLLHNYSVIIKFRNFHNDTLSDINPILILCQLPYCCPCCHLYFPIQGHIQHWDITCFPSPLIWKSFSAFPSLWFILLF